MSRATRAANYAWAKVIVDLDPDQECETPNCRSLAYDRHHKDGDITNNAPFNIAFLCRRCHMIADGRMDKLRARKSPYADRTRKRCVICKRRMGINWKQPICTRCSKTARIPETSSG